MRRHATVVGCERVGVGELQGVLKAGNNLPHVFPTVVHMLADAAARAPESIALVCGERG